MNTSDLISTEMDTPRRVVLTFRTAAAAEQFLATSNAANVAQGAEMHICGECDRQFRAAPPVETALTDDARDAIRREAFDEACAAIKAEDDRQSSNDYMLDSDDCIAVIRALTAAQSASASEGK